MRSCPECGRPNGDVHPRCMYCGASLPPPEEGATSDAPIELAKAFEMLDRSRSPKRSTPLPVPSAPPALIPMDPEDDTQDSIATFDDLPAARRSGPLETLTNSSLEVLSSGGLEALTSSALEALTTDALSQLQGGPRPDEPRPTSLAEFVGKGRTCFGLRSDPYRLFLLPSAGLREPRPELRRTLAQVLGIDLYTAGQYLARPYPVPLGSGKHAAPLEALLRELEAATSLDCLLLPRNELRRRPAPLLASSAERRDGAWHFHGGGEVLRLQEGSVCGTFFAEIRPQAQPLPSASLPAGRDLGRVLRGSGAAEPPRPASSPARGPYWVMDIVAHDEERWVRVRADGFDFRVLPEPGISALQNLRSLSRLLLPPGQELDEGFKRVPAGALSPDDAPEPGAAPEAERRFTEYSLLMGLQRQRRSVGA